MFKATTQGGEKDSNNTCSSSVSGLKTHHKPQERHDQNPTTDPQETAEHPSRDATKAEQQQSHYSLCALVAEPIPLHEMSGSGDGGSIKKHGLPPEKFSYSAVYKGRARHQ